VEYIPLDGQPHASPTGPAAFKLTPLLAREAAAGLEDRRRFMPLQCRIFKHPEHRN
jgi:hypothetical protein